MRLQKPRRRLSVSGSKGFTRGGVAKTTNPNPVGEGTKPIISRSLLERFKTVEKKSQFGRRDFLGQDPKTLGVMPRQRKKPMKKTAALGIGMRVKDLDEDGKFGISLGFPYIAALNYRLLKEGLSPTIGFGLTGPHIGLSYKEKKPKPMKKVASPFMKQLAKSTPKYKKPRRPKALKQPNFMKKIVSFDQMKFPSPKTNVTKVLKSNFKL